jgi:hypothetical protein
MLTSAADQEGTGGDSHPANLPDVAANLSSSVIEMLEGSVIDEWVDYHSASCFDSLHVDVEYNSETFELRHRGNPSVFKIWMLNNCQVLVSNTTWYA